MCCPAEHGWKESSSIHYIALLTIIKCDIGIRKDRYAIVDLLGGTTMLPSIGEHIIKESIAPDPSTIKIQVIAPPERKCLVWLDALCCRR